MTTPATAIAVTSNPSRLGVAAPTVAAFEVLCDINSKVRDADSEDKLTPFHSVAEPPITLSDYLERFVRYLGCEDHGVIMGLVIATRYCRRAKLMPSRLTAHRLAIAGIVIAIKCHHDRFSANKLFSRVGGIPLQELNALELIMFHGCGYHTRIEGAEFEAATDGAADAIALMKGHRGPTGAAVVEAALNAAFSFDVAPSERAALTAAAEHLRGDDDDEGASDTTNGPYLTDCSECESPPAAAQVIVPAAKPRSSDGLPRFQSIFVPDTGAAGRGASSRSGSYAPTAAGRSASLSRSGGAAATAARPMFAPLLRTAVSTAADDLGTEFGDRMNLRRHTKPAAPSDGRSLGRSPRQGPAAWSPSETK